MRITPQLGRTEVQQAHDKLSELVRETKDAIAALATRGYAHLEGMALEGLGSTHRYFYAHTNSQTFRPWKSYLRPLEVMHVVPPVANPDTFMPGQEVLTSALGIRERIPRQGWRRMGPAAHKEVVRIQYGAWDNFGVRTDVQPFTRPLEWYDDTADLHKDYAMTYSTAITTAAFTALALHEAYGMPDDDRDIYAQLYDAWQSEDLGANRGVAWPVARLVGAPIVDGYAERPACLHV